MGLVEYKSIPQILRRGEWKVGGRLIHTGIYFRLVSHNDSVVNDAGLDDL